MDQACSPSANRKGSSSGATSDTLAWGYRPPTCCFTKEPSRQRASRVTPAASPAISREKGSGTAMELRRFSTPSMVRSPVRGGVMATSLVAGCGLPLSIPAMKFHFMSAPPLGRGRVLCSWVPRRRVAATAC